MQQLEELLRGMMQPNTEVVKQASDALNKHLKNSIALVCLLEIHYKSPHPELRQLAAVLMRKVIIGHWGKLKQEVQEDFKRILLEVLLKDPSPTVRKSAATVIAAMARMLVPSGQWNQLLEYLFQCTQSPDPLHREMAMNLFNVLTETIGDYLRPHFQVLHKIFVAGLQDPENKVRLASLRAMGNLVQWLTTDQELASFKELIPLTINVIKYCLQNGLDDDAIQAFEVFDDLMESPMKGVASFVPALVPFVLEVGANKGLDLAVRKQALTLIDWVLQYKPKSLVKNNLMSSLLSVIFPMCAEPEEEGEDDPDELPAHKFASQMVDQIAINVPERHVYVPAMQYIKQWIYSPSPEQRRAAIIALGVLPEGCNESMLNDLDKILPLVYASFKDPDVLVREAACIAIGQFSQFLQPDIKAYYKDVLPCIFQGLDDANEQVRWSSLGAIEKFVEELDEQILPYLDSLMTKLIQLLNSNNKDIKEITISAISSAASAAGKSFGAYYDALIPIMIQYMALTEDEDLLIRCRATECVGLLATAVGRAKFDPAFKQCMTLALAGCALDYVELREFTYGFFGNMASIYKEDFKDWLPVIIPIVVASCESTDGIVGVYAEDATGIEGDEDEEEELVNLQVRTGYLDEKSSACAAIGELAEHVGAAFVPYIEKILRTFSSLTHYFHVDVRQAVVTSLGQMMIAVNAANPPQKPWVKGVSEQEQPLNPNSRQFVDIIMPLFVDSLQNEEDKAVVVSTCRAVEAVVKLMGPAAVEKHLAHLVSALAALLKKKTKCFYEDEEEQAEEDGGDVEMEIEVIEYTCDCLVDIATVVGPLIAPFFEYTFAEVQKYMQKESPRYRSLAAGALAEMSNAMGPLLAQYCQTLFPMVFQAMDDADEETRSNATFWCGVLLLHGGDASVQYYQQALVKLAPLFNNTALIPNLIDNACGAVARMILSHPEALPLDQVLPVFLRALPLRKDFEENKTVYPALFTLYQQHFQKFEAVLTASLPLLVSVFAKALGNDNVQQEYQVNMVSMLKVLLQQNASNLQQMVSALPPQEQQNLTVFLSK